MVAITAQIIPDAEAWLRENIRDLTADSVCSIHPVDEINLDAETTYIDRVDDSTKTATMQDHVNALQKLADLIGAKQLFVGELKSPTDLIDPCNWDAEVVDAFRQLVFHGEVIYG